MSVINAIVGNKDVKTEALVLGIKSVTGFAPLVKKYETYNEISFTPQHAKIIENLVIKGLDSSGKPSNVRIQYGTLVNAGTVVQGAKLLWPYILAIGAVGFIAGNYYAKRKGKKNAGQ